MFSKIRNWVYKNPAGSIILFGYSLFVIPCTLEGILFVPIWAMGGAIIWHSYEYMHHRSGLSALFKS